MIIHYLLNFTGPWEQGWRNHGYFWEMGMLRLWTMRGGFQHTYSRAWLESSSQVAWIMVKICVLLPVEGAENAIFTSYSHNMGRAFCQALYYVLVSFLGLHIFLFLYFRNIQSILKKLTAPSPVTNSVAKMMTASGGHGSLQIRSAVSLPIALTPNTAQDIQMPDPAQTASVDSKRKNLLFDIINFLHLYLLF